MGALIAVIVLVLSSIVVNVVFIVRDKKKQKKERGVYMLKKRVDELAKEQGISYDVCLSNILQSVGAPLESADKESSHQNN